MAVVLALASALCWGAGDFIGGSAAKRTAVTAVIVVSQLAGLVGLLAATRFVSGTPDVASLLWGAGAGVTGGLALMVFYRSLATGTMSIVAPLAALANAALPVVVGVGFGERPAPVVWAGVVLAVAGAVLVSAEGGRLPGPVTLIRSRATAGALLAGGLFGLFFVLISRSGSGSGLWPLAAARIASITLIAVIALVARRRLRPTRSALGPIVAAGLLDMGANVLFLLATRQGLLIITAVLGALYPVSTVLLARAVLRERTSGPQLAGFAVAAVAVTCIAIG